MDNCNKWLKRKLQKLSKRMYRICFDFTRRYFGVSLFSKQKKSRNFTARNLDKPVLKLARSESTDVSSAGCHRKGV